MSLYKKTVSLYAGSRVPIQKNRVPIRRGPCTRDFLVQGLLEDPGSAAAKACFQRSGRGRDKRDVGREVLQDFFRTAAGP